MEKMSSNDISNKIKLFADGVSIENSKELIEMYGVKGFTTNPTLMRKLGVSNYEFFAKDFLSAFPGYPVSFEVFEDDLKGMERQAKIIDGWGDKVYVKIPVMNTKRESTRGLIKKLSDEGIKVNTTAVFTKKQIEDISGAYNEDVPAVLSIFAGRIADSGRDPKENIRYALDVFKNKKNVEILWASTREVYNIIEAIDVKSHIITVSYSILKKIGNIGMDLTDFSEDTVKMFRRDALSSGYEL
jgi:transaldolase